MKSRRILGLLCLLQTAFLLIQHCENYCGSSSGDSERLYIIFRDSDEKQVRQNKCNKTGCASRGGKFSYYKYSLDKFRPWHLLIRVFERAVINSPFSLRLHVSGFISFKYLAKITVKCEQLIPGAAFSIKQAIPRYLL